MSEDLVKRIINKFGENLNDYVDKNYFSLDYITTKKYVEGRQCHARVQGILAKTGHDLGFAVDVERLYPNMKKCLTLAFPVVIYAKDQKKKKLKASPDIIYADDEKETRVIIEYESHNSPDWKYCVTCCKLMELAEMYQPDVCLLIATVTDYRKPGRSNHKILLSKIKDNFKSDVLKVFNNYKTILAKTTFCLCALDDKGLHPEIFDKEKGEFTKSNLESKEITFT